MPEYARIGLAASAMLIFACGFAAAFFEHNDALLNLFAGAAIGMAGAGVNYYLGSSSSSDKKSDIIAATAAAATNGTRP